jgi:hypothetical protein
MLYLGNYESPEERFKRIQDLRNIRNGLNKPGGLSDRMSNEKRSKNRKKRKK